MYAIQPESTLAFHRHNPARGLAGLRHLLLLRSGTPHPTAGPARNARGRCLDHHLLQLRSPADADCRHLRSNSVRRSAMRLGINDSHDVDLDAEPSMMAIARCATGTSSF